MSESARPTLKLTPKPSDAAYRVKGIQAAPAAHTGSSKAAADGIRLNKRMADLGLCSRREADAWIENGWVSVNGQVAQMGQKVVLQDRIETHRHAQAQQAQQLTVVMHKPVGFVSGQAEDGHTPAVTLITPANQWAGAKLQWRGTANNRRIDWRGLVAAGRLDIDSTGLLVLTQDGRIAKQLIGENSPIEKEYLVRVSYAPSLQTVVSANVQAAFPIEQLQRLRHGLSLDGVALKPAQVDWQNPEQLRFVLIEGKKRQIRRMCELVGLRVTALKRVRMGQVRLGDLPAGQWRLLQAGEGF